MATDEVTLQNLGNQLFDALSNDFKNGSILTEVSLESECDKLAVTLRILISAVVSREMSKGDAQIIFEQQLAESVFALLIEKGKSPAIVETSLMKALNTIKDCVNSKIGFHLL